MDKRLFPLNLPDSEWVKFDAEGFSQPVTGVIFRNGSAVPGMPLGAIGTGFISLGTDGTLDYFSTIFNSFLERTYEAEYALRMEGKGSIHRRQVPSLRLPFLGLAVGSKTWVLSLKRIKGVENVRQIHYWGHYPVADLEYEIDAPVNVGLRTFVPFLPGDAITSNTPGAIFEVRLCNISGNLQKGTLVFSFHGPRENEISTPPLGLTPFITGEKVKYPPVTNIEYQRKSIKGEFTGTTVRTQQGDLEYGYALGVSGKQNVRAGGPLNDDGNAWNNIISSLPEPNVNEAGASVAVDFSLSSGESKKIIFVLAWYAPVWRGSFNARTIKTFIATYVPGMGKLSAVQEVINAIDWAKIRYNLYVHMYKMRFRNAMEVAEFLVRNKESLLERILKWQEVVYTEDRLPGWLQDCLINVLATIAQESFWAKSAEREHWSSKDGIFSGNDSLLDCAQQSCIACDWIGQLPIDLLFPELSRNTVRIFKRYQKEYGQVPSTLGAGTELDRRWYDQQISMDGQVYVQLIDRLWQRTGDDGVLEEFYPSVKADINFMKLLDKDGDGLIESFGYSQYYDLCPIWGAAINVSGFWLATLRIVERMAKKMGDNTFVHECRDWFIRGSKSLEEKLWNEKTKSYLLYHDMTTGNRSDTILSDQLVGQWLGYIHGFPDIFPAERVQTVLETIWNLNVSTTPYGAKTAVRPGGNTDNSGSYFSQITPSYSTTIPAMLMLYLRDQRGEELLHRVWHHLIIDLKMTWDGVGMLDSNGEHAWGLEYWHNTMLWIVPAGFFGQDLYSLSSQGGFIDRIVRSACSEKKIL